MSCLISSLSETTPQAERVGSSYWQVLLRAANLTFVALAGINIFFVVFLWFNHINFPLNLDLMEGTVLQHFQRAVAFKPIYPEPTPTYVPLAYNPLYYLLTIPFAWIFGVNLFTLRLVAILGMLGSGLIIFLVVRQKTASLWWSIIAAGLFAAAYKVMDAYLDTAHSDSWFLFMALLGTYIIDRNRSRLWNLIGVVVLVADFWFKQHGALFAVGGLLFLTWRQGLKSSILYWLVGLILGPIFYIFIGPSVFGSHFHYFTWEVPRHWSELTTDTFHRYIGFIAEFYPILAFSGTLLTGWAFRSSFKNRDCLNIWHTQFIFAVLTGFMGTLDIGSSNNVYIPMGTWFILVGTLGLHQLVERVELAKSYKVHLLALVATFTLFIYNPNQVIVSSQAAESYADLLNLLHSLDGQVYAPSLGQLPDGYTFYPAAHWVALEDMIRGPGHDTRNHPLTRRLLDPALHPQGSAFILANYPLEVYPFLEFLKEDYVLETDFGNRFKPLRVLPKRWDQGWPRYLYRYAPKEAAQQTPDGP